MNENLITAFSKGYERMAAWSDLLDDINLYPVPDSDTGSNLKISLVPLKSAKTEALSKYLLMSATGNSGNIAGAFFSKFTQIETMAGIPDAAVAGNDAAWRALQDPKPGTMLTVFSALAGALQSNDMESVFAAPDPIIEHIKVSVQSTTELLTELRRADVVDSGALGMFLFFEGFLKSLANQSDHLSNPYALFGDKIKISGPIEAADENGYCIDTVIIPSSDVNTAVEEITTMGEHVVAVSDGRKLKVHLHAPDASSAQKNISDMGDVIDWKSEKIDTRKPREDNRFTDPRTVHIVTDAAGSLTQGVARQLGITLLDSYIILNGEHRPESMVSAHKLYEALSLGRKATTAQASIFERHQRYEYLTQRFSILLYLCVGSVYTGNYDIAGQWAAQNRNRGRMVVIDTGAASGRLGLIATSVAGYAKAGYHFTQVMQYAQDICSTCDELIFLDQLKYLAASGRISKSSGFFGDLLKIKPIIRPGPQGAQKIGVVKKERQQVEFLLSHLAKSLEKGTPAQILLQYTNNQDRVMSHIRPQIQERFPLVHISVRPMSLTSGVHMGPGTWAAAFLPDAGNGGATR
jgi:DegV family protein with EDD domain